MYMFSITLDQKRKHKYEGKQGMYTESLERGKGRNSLIKIQC